MSWRSHNDHWSAPCFTAPESTVWWGHSAQTHFANQWGASHQTAEMHPFHYWALTLTWPNLLEILPCFVSFHSAKEQKKAWNWSKKYLFTVYCFPFCLVLVQWWQDKPTSEQEQYSPSSDLVLRGINWQDNWHKWNTYIHCNQSINMNAEIYFSVSCRSHINL